jgi:hypothetical protein
MTDKRHSPENLIAFLLKGGEPDTGLQNEIMNKIGALAKRQKAKRAKEKRIVIIYVSVTLAVLLMVILFYAYKNDRLRTHSSPPEGLGLYYTLFIIAGIFALMSFGAYFSGSKKYRGVPEVKL